MLDYPVNYSVSAQKLLRLISVQQNARNHSNNPQHNLSPPLTAPGFFCILALEDVLSVKKRLVHVIIHFLFLPSTYNNVYLSAK